MPCCSISPYYRFGVVVLPACHRPDTCVPSHRRCCAIGVLPYPSATLALLSSWCHAAPSPYYRFGVVVLPACHRADTCVPSYCRCSAIGVLPYPSATLALLSSWCHAAPFRPTTALVWLCYRCAIVPVPVCHRVAVCCAIGVLPYPSATLAPP